MIWQHEQWSMKVHLQVTDFMTSEIGQGEMQIRGWSSADS